MVNGTTGICVGEYTQCPCNYQISNQNKWKQKLTITWCIEMGNLCLFAAHNYWRSSMACLLLIT